ncbi:hypothetical protein OH491_13585 [Termitidicoccus mucosus]|uniref:Uncharacterized protein n=1 Tax=Termitidicoccus mucosus TaxID=1184151 RepID=A0A178IH65_9BACT|nr:hypothetical protein AW736_13865 [Opitutaceae bacterium TSB47]
MKKPRSDAKLKSLPPHQREMLVRWLAEENVSYEIARDRLWQDFNVRTSIGALVNFYATQCWQRSSEHAREFASQVREAAKSTGEDFNAATLALIQERAFVLSRTQGSDVSDLATLAKIIGDSARLQLKQKELALNLDKFRQQVKSDIEKGLDALHAEIKGNAEALQLFEKFKAAVLRSTEGEA